MDNFSQISLGFVEETSMQSTPPPVAREDQPVNIGVRIKKLKSVDAPAAADMAIKKEESESVAAPVADLSDSSSSIADEEAVIADFAPITYEPATSFAVSEDAPAGSGPAKIKSGRGRKSIRQIAEEAELIRIPEDDVLFQKQYYTMGEVAEMFRVNQSLLRFWEAEFDILQPKKNKKGDRYFRPADIKNLHLIYHLLRQRKYTIEGAKDFLRKGKKAEEKFEAIKKLEQIRDFLLEMKASIR